MKCYGGDANGESARRESDAVTGRWRCYSTEQLENALYDFNLMSPGSSISETSRSHNELLLQIEDDLLGALENVRIMLKASNR